MSLGWVALALVYLAGLFWLARWGDGRSLLAKKLTSHPAVYSLALAIYCTAWTFFGAVGEAARNSWEYLPIFLGPMLLYLFGYRFLYKLALVSKKQHITTVADFIASRYGKRQAVALLVTLIALLATIPYIALQLKAIGSAFLLMSGENDAQGVVFLATFFIGIFAIYFGTKHADVTEYRHGLILAIAFESLIKIFALLALALVIWWSFDRQQVSGFIIQAAPSYQQTNSLSFSFWAQTFMAAAAVVCLPRQFHVAIVDNLSLGHLRTARWLFPLYLGLLAVLIPYLAAAGHALFAQNAAEPDTYVLNLAILSDKLLLQMLVFVGGLSASTAMIIVATLTLSTMVTNDVILPKLLTRTEQSYKGINFTPTILAIRRLAIGILLLLSYFYHQQMTGSKSLASIGLIAFSLVIQLLPAIVGGLYWKRGHAHGVYAGLLSAMFTWMLWLFLPLFNNSDIQLQNQFIVQGAILSLVANALAYSLFSYFSQPKLIDRVQAQAFVAPKDPSIDGQLKPSSNTNVDDLLTLLSMFLGDNRCERLLQDYQSRSGTVVDKNTPPNEDFIQFCERALGGVIGASSAKALIDSAIGGKKLNFEEVMNFFDDTTQALKFNMAALLTSLENLDQGISVIDKNLNLVAWNKRYMDLFDYPPDMLAVGVPIETLVRYNAERGECGVGEINMLVSKRMEYLRHGSPHRFLRQRSDGKVIEMVGNPLPGGGFVTSFNDITEHIEIQHALEDANIDLENRIQKRTEEVQEINAELRNEIQRRAEAEKEMIAARQHAEQANASKTRFLALASHDILQPLNAAKLYVSSLQESSMDDREHDILTKLNDSVTASEALIATLLDIARLDQGELQPKTTPLSLKTALQPLIDEFSMKAEQKSLQLHSHIPDLWVNTDPTYLHRVVRNLLSNAVKYTESGKVLLAIRPRKDRVLLQVWDTGLGVDSDEQDKIFNDFYRVESRSQRGIGLGLSVVARLCHQLNSPIQVRSQSGKGSCFWFELPRCEPQQVVTGVARHNSKGLAGLNAVVIDDQRVNLDAMQALLDKWQINSHLADNISQALELAKQHTPDILLVDYQLGDSQTGLEFISQVRQLRSDRVPAILITANREEELIAQCKAMKVAYLSKPVKPAKLRSLIQSQVSSI
ncbi:PAS domain-containing hybrid sensor histidine kinase/response regulator [Neptunicella marina]|uniref:histidine kinase n=1 Tax=Neptunicella marina TaxID=2125989 RepID=A0A8J6ITL9_9ALTE|nr:hybrid sensor histidine kinase/response regulator [Neptunicella marina]MBC3766094.1 PAS-domain containing protein [Neptunicella marina]